MMRKDTLYRVTVGFLLGALMPTHLPTWAVVALILPIAIVLELALALCE